MKKSYHYKLFSILVFILGFGTGCDEYLDQTPEATITEDYIFSSYRGFQGFMDAVYTYMDDYWIMGEGNTLLFGDEALINQTWSASSVAANGNYWGLIAESSYRPYNHGSKANFGGKRRGLWTGSWYGIRQVNLALEKLSLLTDATPEEKNKIEGQAYFFRAFFYWELCRSFGGMPYVDKYLGPEDDLNLPRLSYQETTEKMLADFDKAAALLPVSWANGDDGHEIGRPTKGAVLAFKAKALLYAGSPLMVNESTKKGYEFDDDYMKRAAQAAYEVIKMADQGIYELIPMDVYNNNFTRNDGPEVWTKEIILNNFHDANSKYSSYGQNLMSSVIQRIFIPTRFGPGGGHAMNHTPTQNLVDMFEMQATGLPIDDPGSGFDPTKPWEGRDPRLRNGILVDRDEWSVSKARENAMKLYVGGSDRNGNHPTPYDFKKCWPKTANKFDNQYANYRVSCPYLRLSGVYLIYAEAMNEAFGPNGTDTGLPLSAVQAINKIRGRRLSAGDQAPIMPPVNSKYTAAKEVFRERIRNEAVVELYFEGDRWFDLRRWHVAHEDKYKVIHGLEFDKDWTYFNKVAVRTKVFEERHYWVPIPTDQTQLYSGFYQNPGW